MDGLISIISNIREFRAVIAEEDKVLLMNSKTQIYYIHLVLQVMCQNILYENMS